MKNYKRMNFQKRNQQLRDKLSEIGLDGILVTRPENVFYLIGINNLEGVYFLHKDGALLFTDFRYFGLVKDKEVFFDIVQCKNFQKDMGDWFKKNDFKNIGFESGHLAFETHKNWKKSFTSIILIPCIDLVEGLRLVKDKYEQAHIKMSAKILGEVMDEIPEMIKKNPDMTERDLSIELDYQMKTSGAQRSAFDIIVASDERSAFPHATPTDHIIEKADLLLVDCGAVYEGYHTDMTRVMMLQANHNHRIQEIYAVVRDAQVAAMSIVSPGTPAKEIDMAARDVIKKAGFAEYFGHGTGHGVGLMIHEEPKINMRSEAILKEGMVFTIEPGIYLQNEFGIRWEDMVLVTDDGYDLLTSINWENLNGL